MTHVTCGLIAKNRDELRNFKLDSHVWAAFSFFYCPGVILYRREIAFFVQAVSVFITSTQVLLKSFRGWRNIIRLSLLTNSVAQAAGVCCAGKNIHHHCKNVNCGRFKWLTDGKFWKTDKDFCRCHVWSVVYRSTAFGKEARETTDRTGNICHHFWNTHPLEVIDQSPYFSTFLKP